MHNGQFVGRWKGRPRLTRVSSGTGSPFKAPSRCSQPSSLDLRSAWAAGSEWHTVATSPALSCAMSHLMRCCRLLFPRSRVPADLSLIAILLAKLPQQLVPDHHRGTKGSTYSVSTACLCCGHFWRSSNILISLVCYAAKKGHRGSTSGARSPRRDGITAEGTQPQRPADTGLCGRRD